MIREALCRVEVTGGDGRKFAADVFAGAKVRLYRVGSKGHLHEIGEGRFVQGEILGMPGGAVVADERVYAAIEGGIAGYFEKALS